MKRYLFLLLLITSVSAKAQLYIGVRGGVTLPQGYYAESHMSDNQWMFTQGHQKMAGAGRGWSGGVDVSFALPVHPALEITFQADYLQSGVSRNVAEYYDLRWSSRFQHCSQYLMELPKLRNIPIMAGVRYAYPTSKTIDFYGEALAGVNLRYISDWNFAYSGSDWPIAVPQSFSDYACVDLRTYAPATTFAFRLGAGFIIAKKVTIGASYNVLGASPLVWDQTVSSRYDSYGNIIDNTRTEHVDYYDINPTMLIVHLGFRLPAGGRTVQDW